MDFFGQSDDAVNPDRLYDLVAVVIHCGSGPNRGHYISIVKSHGFWLLFDDDAVDVRRILKIKLIFLKFPPFIIKNVFPNGNTYLRIFFKFCLYEYLSNSLLTKTLQNPYYDSVFFLFFMLIVFICNFNFRDCYFLVPLQKIDASNIADFYGLTSDIHKTSETGYILFYQSRDCS